MQKIDAHQASFSTNKVNINDQILFKIHNRNKSLGQVEVLKRNNNLLQKNLSNENSRENIQESDFGNKYSDSNIFNTNEKFIETNDNKVFNVDSFLKNSSQEKKESNRNFCMNNNFDSSFRMNLLPQNDSNYQHKTSDNFYNKNILSSQKNLNPSQKRLSLKSANTILKSNLLNKEGIMNKIKNIEMNKAKKGDNTSKIINDFYLTKFKKYDYKYFSRKKILQYDLKKSKNNQFI